MLKRIVCQVGYLLELESAFLSERTAMQSDRLIQSVNKVTEMETQYFCNIAKHIGMSWSKRHVLSGWIDKCFRKKVLQNTPTY
jgi:hypothetical protein